MPMKITYAILFLVAGAYLGVIVERAAPVPPAQKALSVRPATDLAKSGLHSAAGGIMNQPIGIPCGTWLRESHDWNPWVSSCVDADLTEREWFNLPMKSRK